MSIAIATNRYTAALRAHERHSASEITAAHTRLKQATAPVFARIVKSLSAEQASGQTLGVWWLYEQNRLQSVQDTVHKAVSTYSTSASDTVQKGRQRAIEIGAAAALWQLGKRIKQVARPALPRMAARASGIVDRFTHWIDDTKRRVTNALLLAASLGITLGMAEMLLNKAIDRLLPLAIGADVTQEYDAFRDTLLMWYQANSDVVEAWQWATAEDERVCAFCESMDGTIHPLYERMESHNRCRCEEEPYFIDTSGDLLQIGA